LKFKKVSWTERKNRGLRAGAVVRQVRPVWISHWVNVENSSSLRTIALNSLTHDSRRTRSATTTVKIFCLFGLVGVWQDATQERVTLLRD